MDERLKELLNFCFFCFKVYIHTGIESIIQLAKLLSEVEKQPTLAQYEYKINITLFTKSSTVCSVLIDCLQFKMSLVYNVPTCTVVAKLIICLLQMLSTDEHT